MNSNIKLELMKTKIINYINKYGMLNGCGSIVMGLSGGADSVCLLLILDELCRHKNIALTAVHIHHGIRGQEADRDMAFCEDLCRRRGIAFECFGYDVPKYAAENGLTCEEAGRKLRYMAFKEVASGFENARIAVAHHMDDRAETVIFNMCRGSSLKGIRGILPVNDNIIRPLLCCSKVEILDFLAEEKQDYCRDNTNFENDYSRNRIRNIILPELVQDINSGSVKNIVAMSEDVAEAEDFLAKTTNGLMNTHACRTDRGILLTGLNEMEPYMAKRLIMKCFESLTDSLKDFGRQHVEKAYELASKQDSRPSEIRNGLYASRNQDGLYIYINSGQSTMESYDVIISEKGITRVAGFSFEVIERSSDKKISNEVYTKLFDYDKIKFGMQIRGRREGDFFALDKSGHHKKLKQYFVDEKVPERQRDFIPLLAEGNHILWIPGGRISAEYMITDKTQRVLRVSYEGEKTWNV